MMSWRSLVVREALGVFTLCVWSFGHSRSRFGHPGRFNFLQTLHISCNPNDNFR
jgi:hypothetical protein